MSVSRKQFHATKERIERLEKRADDEELPVRGDEGPPPEGQAFFDELRNRMGAAKSGLISIIGGVYRFAPGRNVYWQSRHSNHPLRSPVVKCSDDDVGRLLSAFSSIQRVRLLEAMVGAVHSATELREKTRLSKGALRNHLRALMAADFVERRGRGRYTLTGTGMSGIIAVLHLAHDSGRKRARSRSG